MVRSYEVRIEREAQRMRRFHRILATAALGVALSGLVAAPAAAEGWAPGGDSTRVTGIDPDGTRVTGVDPAHTAYRVTTGDAPAGDEVGIAASGTETCYVYDECVWTRSNFVRHGYHVSPIYGPIQPTCPGGCGTYWYFHWWR
jgi:hypothetical protein